MRTTVRKTRIALVLGLAMVASAGLAGAAYSGQAVWGDSNPGQGTEHSMMPAAGLEHNQAGAVHPPDFAGAPDDVPPDHPTPPDDVPPEDAGAPDSLPDQADGHASDRYPPDALQ